MNKLSKMAGRKRGVNYGKNNELNRIIKIYQNNGRKPITFDFKEAYNSLVNENNNINYHYLHFYPGRIYPEFIHIYHDISSHFQISGR